MEVRLTSVALSPVVLPGKKRPENKSRQKVLTTKQDRSIRGSSGDESRR